MRAIVVGASSGLGRCIGIGLAERGAEVALLARRYDRLVETAKAAGPGALAIQCDVTDEVACQEAIDEAVRGLGGLDALVYAPGVGPLARIEDIDGETWRRALDTNLLGAAFVTRAAFPHLQETHGIAAYLSSISASTVPWPGLAAYVVSKTALDRLVEAWRTEHPSVGFTRVIVGDCASSEGLSMSEFNAGWDMELFQEIFPLWQQRGFVGNHQMAVHELVDVVDHVLRRGASASVPSVTITPRPPTDP